MMKHVVIVGAGISGTSLGILLAQKGINVSIIEKESRTKQNQEDDRSANFTITNRGLLLLDKIGARAEVMAASRELTHRIVHTEDNLKLYQEYGSSPLDHPRSIRRSDLIYILQAFAQNTPNLEIHHNWCVTYLDKVNGSIKCSSTLDQSVQTMTADLVVGADGAFSTIRQHMIKGALIDSSISYFEWVYKKLIFSPIEAKNLNLDLNGLHLWPRKKGVLFGLPNLDGSVACIFCAEFDKELDLQSPEANNSYQNLFLSTFPELQGCSSLLQSHKNAKISAIVNIEISSFHYQEKVVLVGDACHALFPFYGQGMNAALEDCLALVSALEERKFILRKEALVQYSLNQKRSADALQYLSAKHFFELRNNANTPLFEVRSWTSHCLERFFPGVWKNEYSMIVRGGTPYDQALSKMSRQNICKWIFMVAFLEFCLVPFFIFKRWFSKKSKSNQLKEMIR